MMRPAREETAAVVAFDVARHSAASRRTQLARIRGMNEVVARALGSPPDHCVLWASAGDGGNVLFLMDGWQRPALDLVRKLYRWAERGEVPLRIAGHVGDVAVIPGADGRRQPVGDAINEADGILERGSPAGIVVSSQFRLAAQDQLGVEFHDQRQLRLKHGTPLELWLLSLPELGLRSRWSDAVRADRQQLLDAIAEHRGMDAVYYAKRLLQVNGVDEEVTEALAGLGPMDFRYVSANGDERVNPVLAHLDPGRLRKMLGQGQLVERSYNEVLCQRGDTGSTMFVILRGQIGVYTADDGATPEPARPRVTLSEGQIVGELAFALSRRRTADLVSLGNTALLSFEYDEVAKLLNGSGEMIWDFMNRRALEHVSQNVAYLIGRQLSTLPQDERQMWRGMLNVLRTDCQIISCGRHQRITLGDVRPCDDDRAGGIYILASGLLQSESNPDKRLDGDGFPLLYVDLPDLVVAPDHAYTVEEGPAKIIYIGLEAINALRHPVHTRLVGQLKRSMASMYHYDVFIAYTAADEAAAERWERALTHAGLRVFRDAPHPGDAYPTRDGAALLDSLTTLVLVSRRTADRETDRNWVRKEIDFRERHFDRQPQIVPIQLPGGDPQEFELYYSQIDAVRREHAAIQEAVELVRAIRGGDREPPHALRRHPGTRIA
jgi:CRP-like cAMP-binding protein/class 3 adenylate cyclase